MRYGVLGVMSGAGSSGDGGMDGGMDKDSFRLVRVMGRTRVQFEGRGPGRPDVREGGHDGNEEGREGEAMPCHAFALLCSDVPHTKTKP